MAGSTSPTLSRINHYWQRFVSCNGIFTPEHRDYRRAYLINAMLLASLCNFGTFVLLNFLVFDLLAPGLLNLVAFIGAAFTLLYFQRSRNIIRGGFYTTLIIGLALVAYLYIEQHYQYSLFWLATFPPFAYFLNGLKRGSWSILLVFLPVYLLMLTGLDRWEAAPWTIVSLANVVIASFALTALVFFYEKSRHQASSQLQRSKEREATARERNRLLREMHDGLGAQLTSALYAARSQQVSVEEMADYLQLALEDLRMMMDSLQTFDGDVATLLGQLRYRMERRLQAAGLKLVWKVDDLPDLPEMTPQNALNLQRIVQESLINVIKHAQASEVELVARLKDRQTLQISITDNGCGFNLQDDASGRGLSNLHHRATELQAELSIRTATTGKGTRVLLTIPVRRP
ncbi:sensor histidine kinase [Marinospirillum alkaliphilum]|uniref:Signal transduction histidine kinase n=1 Tax=Marinospirillum alkaliphilum DSM 21637 TaxID=1122209 RepID=A0A1K1TV60_9GAMM|nr:ATP-binding protein [Marinospirillum alkaliphilum]SFX04673.1 Signal transduction histidine kinase [Marinospirillum alkaliphilum DSM 21637]